MMQDFHFPNIDWDCHGDKGLDGVGFVKCVQGPIIGRGQSLINSLGIGKWQMTKMN